TLPRHTMNQKGSIHHRVTETHRKNNRGLCNSVVNDFSAAPVDQISGVTSTTFAPMARHSSTARAICAKGASLAPLSCTTFSDFPRKNWFKWLFSAVH